MPRRRRSTTHGPSTEGFELRRAFIPSYVGREVFDKEVEAYIIEARKSRPPGEYPELIQYSEDVLRVTGLDSGRRHIRASPLFELGSIKLIPNTRRSCLIYGQVLLIDTKSDNSLVLYKKDYNDAEFVDVNENAELSLTGLTIAPLKDWKLAALLFDKTQGADCIADGSFDVSMLNNYSVDLKSHDIRGNCGRVSVSFRSNASAVVADVSVSLYKKSADIKGHCAQVYGAIRVRRDEPFKDLTRSMYDLTLFEKGEHESVKVDSGGIVGLSRSKLIVPAYSSISIGVFLLDSENECTIVRGIAKFNAFEPHTTRHQVWGEENKWMAIVEVDWSMCDELAATAPSVPSISSVPPYMSYVMPLSQAFASGLVEIFSVSINCNHVGHEFITGTITVRDEDGVFYIFAEDDRISGFHVWWPPRCAKASNFRMNVKLRSRDGTIICNGFLDLSYEAEDLDRCMCSVIRGEWGIVTIHYSVFVGCQQGIVAVELVSATSHPMGVSGHIVAKYRKYKNTSSYDMSHDCSLLFDPHPQVAHYCESGSLLALRKSAVIGRTNGALIISSCLEVCPVRGGKFSEHKIKLLGQLMFEPGCNSVQCIDVGESYRINVSLVWEKVN